MQNVVPKFGQSSNISEKPGYLSEILKILTSSNTIEYNSFCWSFAHVSYLTIFAKGCSGFFYFV